MQALENTVLHATELMLYDYEKMRQKIIETMRVDPKNYAKLSDEDLLEGYSKSETK